MVDRSLLHGMIVTRAPGISSLTCISHLRRRRLFLGRLTSDTPRRISACLVSGMDFPAGLTHPKAEEPIVSIGKNSVVYPLGVSTNSRKSTPSLRFEDCGMVVEEGQAWVVVGTSGAGKDVLLQVSQLQFGNTFSYAIVLAFSAIVIAGSDEDPPVSPPSRWPLSVLNSPTCPTRPIQIRLPRFLFPPTKVSDWFLGLLSTIWGGVGRRQTDVTRDTLPGISRKDSKSRTQPRRKTDRGRRGF